MILIADSRSHLFNTSGKQSETMETSTVHISSEKDEIIDSILKIADLANANFKRDTVNCVFELIEQGVDPESITEGEL